MHHLISSSERFSTTFVEVFRSDGTDTSVSLQQAHQLAWSLIPISGLSADSSLPYVSAYARELWLLRFRLPSRLLFISPLLDFNTVMLARILMDICSCLIVPLWIVSFCKFGTARYDVTYCFFMLVAYPAQCTGAALHNPCKIRLVRETVVQGCNYQSLCLSFQSRVLLSQWLVLKSSTSASLILLKYLPCSSFLPTASLLFFGPVALSSVLLF